MTDNEKLIAETAISRRDMATYDEIHHDVAHALNMKKERVVRTLDVLVSRCIVKRCGAPVNHAAEPSVPPQVWKASYEKGEMWDK